MSRVSTDFNQFQQNQTQIQPQATPTDQFTAPAIRHKDPGSLFSLADSLKQLNPQLQQVADRQMAGAKVVAFQQAERDYANARVQNIKDYQSAVKSGMLGESANPWYQVHLKQLFATDTMNSAKAGALTEYNTNDKLVDSAGTPLRFSDKTNEVNQYFKGRMTDAMKGADAWEAEAMVPMAQQTAAALTMNHEAARQQERPMEMQAAFQQNIGSILAPLNPATKALAATVKNQTVIDSKNPDPKVSGPAQAALHAQTVVMQAQQGLQHALDNAGHTTNPVLVKKWMHDTITSAALDRRDSSVFTELYGGLKKRDGSPLDNSDEMVQHGIQLTRKITTQQLEDKRLVVEGDLLQNQKDTLIATKGWADWVQKRKDVDPAFSQIRDITPKDMSDYISTLPPGIRMSFQNNMAAAAISLGQATSIGRTEWDVQHTIDNAADLANGRFAQDPNARKAFIVSLLSHTGNFPAAIQAERLMRMTGQTAPEVSSDEVHVAVIEMRMRDKDVSLEEVNDFVAKNKDQLSKQDSDSLYSHVMQQDAHDPTRMHPMLLGMAESMKQQIESKMVDEKVANPEFQQRLAGGAISMLITHPRFKDTAREEVRSEQSFHNALGSANVALNRFWEGKLGSRDARQAILNDQAGFEDGEGARMVDKIATQYGGYNKQQADKSQADHMARQLNPAPQAEPPQQLPKDAPSPGTPQRTIMDGTMDKLLPAGATVPIPVQGQVNELLARVPAGVTEATRDSVKALPKPYDRWGFLDDPNPEDPVAQLSYWRGQMRDDTIRWVVGGEGNFQAQIPRARAAAKTYESVLLHVNDKYKHMMDSAHTDINGQKNLSPSDWESMSGLERTRAEATHLRLAAGYYPNEVANLMREGDKDAWKTKAMFTNPKVDFDPNNPQSAKKMQDTLKILGIDKSQYKEFTDYQKDLALQLRKQQ